MTHRSASGPSRYPFIDTLKAVGILLVVLGHAPGMPKLVNTLIFGFHVPLFFFASGFLLGGADAQRPWQRSFVTTAGVRVRRLLLPYAGFFLLSWLYWLLTRHVGNSAGEYAALAWWAPLADLVGGYGSYVNPTLWFFPCLAVTLLLHLAARRRLSGRPLLAACVVPGFIGSLAWSVALPRLPWQLDTAMIGLAFFALGHYCRERAVLANPAALAPGAWLWAVPVGAVYVAFALSNPGVDLANMGFGLRPAFYLPVALLGIAATVLAARSVPDNRLSRWLSDNTLYIFPLHWLMFRVFTGVGIVVFGLPRDFKDDSWLIGTGYAGLALLLCWPAAALLRRAAALFAQRASRSSGESSQARHGARMVPLRPKTQTNTKGR
jgi:acyltransferase